MHARICIAQAQQAPGSVDLNAVMHQLNQLLQLAEADHRLADRVTILALLAIAHAVAGNSTQTMQILVAAIRLAAPAGYIRTFVDEGAPMRALLQALRGQLPAVRAGRATPSIRRAAVRRIPAERSGHPHHTRIGQPAERARACGARANRRGTINLRNCRHTGYFGAHRAHARKKHLYQARCPQSRPGARPRAHIAASVIASEATFPTLYPRYSA